MAEIVFIVFMVVFAGVAMILLISRARMAEMRLKRELDAASQGGEVEKLLADTIVEVARLRERVAILEKLATDDDRRVANEIEKLRRDEGPAARG